MGKKMQVFDFLPSWFSNPLGFQALTNFVFFGCNLYNIGESSRLHCYVFFFYVKIQMQISWVGRSTEVKGAVCVSVRPSLGPANLLFNLSLLIIQSCLYNCKRGNLKHQEIIFVWQFLIVLTKPWVFANQSIKSICQRNQLVETSYYSKSLEI